MESRRAPANERVGNGNGHLTHRVTARLYVRRASVGDPVGARPMPVSYRSDRKQSKSLGRQQTGESLRRKWAAFRQFSEPAGHNLSERRAGPENVSRKCRPSRSKGKAVVQGSTNDGPTILSLELAGVVTMARGKGTPTQHERSVWAAVWKRPTEPSREAGRAQTEVGEVHSTVEAE